MIMKIGSINNDTNKQIKIQVNDIKYIYTT